MCDGMSGNLCRASAGVMIAKGRETQIAPIDRQFGSKTVGQRAMPSSPDRYEFRAGVCTFWRLFSDGGRTDGKS